MKRNSLLPRLAFAILLLASVACSDHITGNKDSDATSTSTLASFNSEVAGSDLQSIDLGDAIGLVGIQIGPIPQDSTGTIALDARLIVFSGTANQTHPFKSGGLDIGTVTLTHNGQTVTFTKHEVREGGVVYESMPKPEKGVKPVPFVYVAGSPISIGISGTDSFPAQTLNVTPAGVLTLTNLENGATLPSGTDLTVYWIGSAADSMMIRILPAPPAPGTKPDGGGPGGHGPKDGKGPKGGHGPKDGKGPGGPGGPGGKGPKPLYEVATTSASGSYTISSADLTAALASFPGTAIILDISQRSATDVATDKGNLKVLLGTHDGVLLKK